MKQASKQASKAKGKRPQKYHWVLVCWPAPRGACPEGGVDTVRETLKKTDFALDSGCQLQIALRRGPGVHFIPLVFEFVHAATVLWGHRLISLLVWKSFRVVLHPSLALSVFLPSLPHSSLSSEGRGLIKTPYLGLDTSRSLTLFSCGSSLVLVYCKKQLLCCGTWGIDPPV